MEALQEKQCTICKIIKPLSEFSSHIGRKDGKNNQCKQCSASGARRYQSLNPFMTQTSSMVRKARQRAKDKNLPFNIDHDYIRSIAPSHCPVFGIALEWSSYRENGNGALPNSPSLDRIDPSKGYVKGNVWIISHRANTIKNDASHDELKLVTKATGLAIANSLDWYACD
jgi:hypothetical protein